MVSEYKVPKGIGPLNKTQVVEIFSRRMPNFTTKVIKCNFCVFMHRPLRSLCPAVGKLYRKCGFSFRILLYVLANRMCSRQYIYNVSGLNSSKRAIGEAKLMASHVRFLLDLGVNVNLIPQLLVPKKYISPLDGYVSWLGDTRIPTHGCDSLPLLIKGSKKGIFELLVTDVDKLILGLQAYLALKLVSLRKQSFFCSQISVPKPDIESLNSDSSYTFDYSGPHVANHPDTLSSCTLDNPIDNEDLVDELMCLSISYSEAT
uniref:Uncharacterized protein n=1 Tax=Lepeophtheirus salmonis TaxID=72036 RepID=A0A0K2V4R2_LEPSM